MFQYFSDIAQNPESNKRTEAGGGGGPGKPPWPASVCSSSSRESSPFSSKTSDSARDSVYGFRHPTAEPREERNRLREPEHIYDTIGARRARRLSQYSNLNVPLSSHSTSSDHLYAAIPAVASSSRSSSSTLLSGGHHVHHSRDSLDSDSSALAGFTGQERAVDRIRRDCERKKEFLENQKYPAYLSSPPKDVDNNPRGIANLATTMPPSGPKELEPPKAAKNFFMDIYAQEMSKMQTSAKSSAQSKKRNFDASQFNAYGLPLGELDTKYCRASSHIFLPRGSYVSMITIIAFASTTSRPFLWCELSNCGVGEDDSPVIHGSNQHAHVSGDRIKICLRSVHCIDRNTSILGSVYECTKQQVYISGTSSNDLNIL